MATHQEILEKVKKLLALAKGNNNPNEALNATRQANKLIDEHRLSIAEIEMNDSEDAIFTDDEPLYYSNRITQWKSQLCSVLAHHYGCYVFVNKAARLSVYQLVGRKNDMQLCRYMFSWISIECERLAQEFGKGKGRIASQSFATGFVAGIREQLKKSRDEAAQTHTSTALVKLDMRANEAQKAAFSNMSLKRSVSSSSSQLDGSAFSAGKDRGSSFHLGGRLNK